jgi:ubiquinone/menaquinone biosynthesis C-methylase UbiE
VASAFDDLACDYDASFTRTALGGSLRALVWDRCQRLFRPGQTVLELGCGTGEDALHFSRARLNVVAIDPSERMLQVARSKAASLEHDQRPEFHCLPMEAAPQKLAGRTFDGIFSNFGAVNCVSDIAGLIERLAPLCNPGARLLWVVMGRHVPWEWAWYLARLQPRRALRRLQAGGVEWRGLWVRYPTPREFVRFLQPHFAITRVAPLGCVLPPTYAGAWLEGKSPLLTAMTALERAATRFAPLASCADHFMIEAQVK